ncbi:putative uncharacterized protein [Bacteroides sp. CAG:1076]|nr:putative uncharacterized protein [Bacteroides sp. CAG:1076]
MNLLKHFTYPAAAALLLATAACTTDELADGNRLPEGQYPLEIARITLGVEGGEAQPWGAPQTRVSEIADGTGSVFDAGDRFAVQIDGKEEVGTYTVQDDHTVRAETPLYWSDRNDHIVTAWYPATDGTIDLGNQSQSLAYLLGGTGTGKYPDPVTLNFTHALAKVRITPSDDALGKVQSLQLYTYTQCTYEKGNAGQGSQEGWIEMKKCEYTENGATITCWEANVVPGYEIKKLRANGTEERNLSAAFTPEAGKFYNITLNYDKGYNLSADGKTYEVYNANGLLEWNEAARNDLSINCTLIADIDLTGKEWTPIGSNINYVYTGYTGTFDGQGHTISGLTINQARFAVGLIGCIDKGGTVKNVQLKDVNISGESEVGAIAGASLGTVIGCSVEGGSVTASLTVAGGVVGNSRSLETGEHGDIIGCSSSATVQGESSVGGVSGVITDGFITACYSTSDVVATRTEYAADAGGAVGNSTTGTITACYHASGTITGQGNIGGAIGQNTGGVLTACYWSDYDGNGIGKDNASIGTPIKVDGTTVNWKEAVDAMNTALQNAGSEWRYELTGALPTLKKQ